MSRVLLIEPNTSRLASSREALENNGFTVEAQERSTELDVSRYRAVVADAGVLAESELFASLAQAPLVLTTEGGSIPEAVRAIKAGAADYLSLPLDGDQLVAAVERAIAHVTARNKPSHGSRQTFPMVGHSEAMLDLFSRIRKVAPTDSTVLIEGESGTGKELVARALHDGSGRSHAPLITLNCAAVPTDLIESELFGYDSAESEIRAGLVDAAHGGTLFLDEIAELPVEAQAKLLRLVLQGENRPVGSSTTHEVDVRLIVATHRNLAALTETGQFRDDLYYRLNVVRLGLPPLRERREDIPELASHLLQRTMEKLSKPNLGFSDDARSAMSHYGWPGNVRELENAIERAAILCDGNVIDAALLAIDPSPPTPAKDAVDDESETSLEDYFVKFVREHEDHLNETEIAEKLGISRKSLWERRQRLNIPRRKTKRRGPRRP